MFTHGPHGPRVCRHLNDGLDRIADDVALASREDMYGKSSGRL